MKAFRGLELLEEREGRGPAARRGHRVVYNLRILLDGGDVVPMNRTQSRVLPETMLRWEGSQTLVDHGTVIGKGIAIPAVERALLGMKAGGFRKVRAMPYLAYGKDGVPGLIPPNAVVLLEIWLRELAVDARDDGL